jgi:hypothetical protein
LAAVIAQHSPAVRAFEKRVIVRLFRGSTSFGFAPVDADSVVYREAMSTSRRAIAISVSVRGNLR